MPNPNAFDRRYVAVVASALSLAIGSYESPARADEKKVCSSAYDLTQTLRRAGKLQEARAQAATCMRDVCAEFVRVDCAKWFGEIDASQPTVVFEVRDAAGHETNSVRISLDGKPWLDQLDGKAKTIDPGQHAVRYEIEGAAPIEETVQIREGEKNRKFSASFEIKAQATPLVATPPATPKVDEPPPASHSMTPWIVGGVGVTGLLLGGITGAIVLAEKSTFDAHCPQKTCDSTGDSARSTGRALGPVSTIGFIVGGLGVGVSAVWLLTREPEKGEAKTKVGFGPVVTATGAAWRFEGNW